MSAGLRILVDLDDVLASWGGEYDRMLDEAGPRAARIPRAPDRLFWDLKEGRTADEKKIIERIMRDPGFYARLEPIPGAKPVLEYLLECGHDIRIVTAPFISNPTCASDKINWIAKHYGQSWAQRVIISTDKTLVRGDVLIDDRPEITGAAHPDWAHIVFGDYPYNRHITDRSRLKGWEPDQVALAIWEAVVRR